MTRIVSHGKQIRQARIESEHEFESPTPPKLDLF
jgi:hypothetical protein